MVPSPTDEVRAFDFNHPTANRLLSPFSVNECKARVIERGYEMWTRRGASSSGRPPKNTTPSRYFSLESIGSWVDQTEFSLFD
jgi:hypothetical protein